MDCNTNYVYIIQAGDGAIKIGVTNDLCGRLSTLQTGNPIELKARYVVECFSMSVAYALEKLLHEHYQELLVRGEWFNVDPDRVIKDIQFATSLFPLVSAIRLYDMSDEEAETTDTARQYLPSSPANNGTRPYYGGTRYDPFRPTSEPPRTIVQQSAKPGGWHRVTGGDNGT